MILSFLQEFSKLTHAEQKIFLFCLEHCPHPRQYTGDLGAIAQATGLSRTTVYNALRSIRKREKLNELVSYVHHVNIKELIAGEMIFNSERKGSL
jgi:DNA-binding MarR family transcriptional regulator